MKTECAGHGAEKKRVAQEEGSGRSSQGTLWLFHWVLISACARGNYGKIQVTRMKITVSGVNSGLGTGTIPISHEKLIFHGSWVEYTEGS